MLGFGMRTSDVEQESHSTYAPSLGVTAFGLCCGFPPVAVDEVQLANAGLTKLSSGLATVTKYSKSSFVLLKAA